MEEAMKPFVFFLLILFLAASGGAGYFYLENKNAREELDLTRDLNSELQFKVKSLEGQVARFSRQLEEEVARFSREKEAEINRLKDAQNQLVEELKGEIEQQQIKITQLADRLSVSMVDQILFPSGEAELTEAGLKVMERVGRIIKEVADKIIRVEGHTDNVPIHPRLQEKYATNWELSNARATNVVRFLQDKIGIAPERLQAVGLSEFHPVASNKTREGHAKNRRIEIALLPIGEELEVAKE
jgi:chemotaxis protein MotB